MTHLELLRRLRGMTQGDLSATTRIAKYVISMAENGRASFNGDQAQRIATALGTTPDLLLMPVVITPREETAADEAEAIPR